MIITDSLATFGKYCLFMTRVITAPDRWKVFFSRTVAEITKLGIDSVPLVIVISVFIGAVCTIQMQLNISSPLIPSYSTGMATREIICGYVKIFGEDCHLIVRDEAAALFDPQDGQVAAFHP